jgi:hypothetical protein
MGQESIMKLTVSGLLEGRPVERWYRQAKEIWMEILVGIDTTDPAAIARVATVNQGRFEEITGGRLSGTDDYLYGQEVMVVVGILRYWPSDRGFSHDFPEARAMYKGLMQSGCSLEVKTSVEEVAAVFPELADERSV